MSEYEENGENTQSEKTLQRKKNILSSLKPYLFILPAMVILLSLIIYPLVFSLSKSLTDFMLGMPGQRFIGLKNYWLAITNQSFQQSLVFSLIFSIGATTLELVLGFITALILQRQFFWETGGNGAAHSSDDGDSCGGGNYLASHVSA